MSYALSLNYSSKIWRLGTGLPVDRELERRGAFGIGWRLTMGRVFQMCRYGCYQLNNFHYEDSSGTLHPIYFDVPFGVPNVLNGHTSDGTYMRVEADVRNGASYPLSAPDLIRFRIYPGDGLVLTFDDPPPDAAAHTNNPDDFGGLRLSTMQKHGPDPAVIYSWVKVTYDHADPNFAHCITKVEDGIGALQNPPLRTISFTNAATAGGVKIDGGYTTAITVPAVSGQASTTATYNLNYGAPKKLSFGGAEDPNQILLSDVTFPQDPNIKYGFTYDPNSGELTKQTLPTGATVTYAYQDYSYLPEGFAGHSATVREVISKTVAGVGANSTWTYRRYRWSTTGQTPIPWVQYGVVTDPDLNTTRYTFCSFYYDNPVLEGLVKETEIYRKGAYDSSGNPDGSGTLVRKTISGFGVYGTTSDPDVRANGSRTIYVDVDKESNVVMDTPLPNGHFGRTLEYDFDSATEPTRITERTYDSPVDPNDPNAPSDPAKPYLKNEYWTNWITDALVEEKVKENTAHVIRRSKMSYLNDGKIAMEIHLADPAGPGSTDIVTTSTYDSATGLPDRVTVSGGDAGNSYAIKSFYSGPHLIQKKAVDLNGDLFPYFSYDVDVDSKTGLVKTSRDAAGLATNLTYDLLGRSVTVTPPSGELPTTLSYVGLTQTTSLKGTGTDQIVTTSYLDALGRPTETKHLDPNGVAIYQFTCFDTAGRAVFASEPHKLQSGETMGTPPCTSLAGYTGTTTSYTTTENGVTAADPLGRPRTLTTADQAHVDTSFLGLDSHVTNYQINGVPGTPGSGSTAITTYHRDAFGHLTYVEAPAGADARYTYDHAGQLTRVELLTGVTQGAPFAQVRTYVYDALGRLRYATNPENGTVHFSAYDAAGNVLEKFDSDGTRFTMTYDAAGRPVDVSSATLDPNQVYRAPVLLSHSTYDDPAVTNSSGRLTQVDSFDESGTLVVRRKLSYEGLGGRLGHDASTFGMWDAREGIESGDPELITCYTYTTLGLLDSMIYPTAYSGTTCSAPSADVARLNYHYSYGFLQNVNDLRRSGGVLPGSPSTWKLVMATTYNEAGGMNKLTYANGVVQTVTPDVMMRPLTITATKGSTTFLDTGSFAYDGVGNISSIGRTGGSSVKDAFTYDLVGRLTTADVYNKNDNSVNANGQTHERHDWTYDDFGNLTWKDQDPNSVGPAHQFFVDTPTNRILTSSGVSFRYDQRGNLNLDDSHSYLFDERNRLLAARMGQSYPVGEYAYDAGGMRVLKEDPSTGRRTFYVRDGGGNVLSEFTPSGAGFSQGFWQKDYYYALGHVIGQAEEAPPKPVEGLWSQLSATTPAVATLHWTANRESNLSGYIVYRKDPAVGSSWLNVGNVGVPSNPSWTETGSIPSGLRFYRVAAVNAAGESATSRGLRVEPGTSIPAPPTIPITQATLTSVTLRWTRSADDIDALASEPAKNFVGYNVYRNPSPPPLGTGDPLNPVPLRQPVFRDLAVDPNTVYVYTIQSVGSSGGQSAGVQSLGVGTYDRVPPAIPLNVKAAGGPQVGEITILWSPNSEQELAGYHLYRLDLVGGVLVWTLLPATIAKTATSVPVTGIAEGVTTTYALSAYDTSNNESARSESVSAVTRTATPAPPMMLTGQSLVGWWGTSGLVTYGGAGGDASGYWGFRVYKKEQSLPPDQWELIFSDPISHNPGDPSEGIPPSDHFAGTFTDQWIDSCHVTQFLVSGISMNGSQTVDSGVMKIPRALVPETPGVTATQQGQTVTVTFTPRGFVGCDSSGNGFTVTSWTLVEKQTTQAGRNEYPIAGTSYSRTAPPGAQVWAYALKADVKDVLTGETVTSFLGQDVCVTSSGIIGPDDSSCDDLDGSRSVPPPLVPPLPGGTANSGGPSRMEDGTWQWNDMKQDIVRHRFNASLKIPLVEDAAPAQAETRVAVAREVTPYMEAMRLPGSRSLVTAAAEPSIILAGEFKMETRPGSPAVGRRPEDGWWGLPEDDSRVGSSDIDAGGLNLIAMLVTGASPKTFSWQFFNWDHLGSVRVVTDVNGALVAESKFLPYGEEISLPTSATTDNTHRFTGHERDGESGRDYSFARYLSSDGRFLSPDERIVPPTMGRAVAWNRYTYTLDDPILYVDPDGRNPLLIAAGAIAAFVGGTIVVVEAYHAAKDLLSSAKNIEAQDSLYAKTVKACAEGGDCRSDIAMNAVNRGYIAREVALANGISLFKTAVGEARPPIPESNLPETEVIVTQFLDHAADVVLDLFDLFGLMARPGGDSANTAHGAASGAAKSAQGHYFHEGNASDRKVSRGGALYSKLTSDQAGYISQNQRPGRYFVQPVN